MTYRIGSHTLPDGITSTPERMPGYLANLVVVPHEDVATAFDRHNLGAQDAGRRRSGGSARS